MKISTPLGQWNAEGANPRQGPGLLYLHGFAGSHADWDATRAHLPGVALDLPYHAATTAPRPPGRLTFASIGVELDRVGRHAAPDGALWVGYSFGARLLLTLAARPHTRARGLVLVSAHPGLDDVDERRERARQDEADARRLDTEGLDAFLNAWHQRDVFATRRDRGREWEAEVRRRRATNQAPRLAAGLRALGLGQQPDCRPLLETIRIPTLVVSGTLDPKYDALAREIAQRIPDARHTRIPDAGHAPHLENPDVFRAALHKFINELPSGTPTPTAR